MTDDVVWYNVSVFPGDVLDMAYDGVASLEKEEGGRERER